MVFIINFFIIVFALSLLNLSYENFVMRDLIDFILKSNTPIV